MHSNGADGPPLVSRARADSATDEEGPIKYRSSMASDSEKLHSTVRNLRASLVEDAVDKSQNSESEDMPQASDRQDPVQSSSSAQSMSLTEVEDSFDDTEPSSRISIALSDGEVGIGLSLLQDFVGGRDDDGASTFSRRSRSQTPDVDAEPNGAIDHSPESTVEGHAAPSVRSSTRSESQYSSSSRGNEATHSSSHPGPPNARERTSFISVHPSLADSSDFGEEWEGASDIYDNYRYSRYSMASRASRFSKGSMHTLGSGFEVPPVPAEFQSSSSDPRSVERNAGSGMRPSVESRPSTDQPRDSGGGMEERGKHVPPPLDLSSSKQSTDSRKHDSLGSEGEQSTSPLLHATFGSPPHSATPHSTGSYLSTPITPPLFPAATGVASALRQKLELDRPLQPFSSDAAPNIEQHDAPQRRSGFDIVIEDDPHVPSTDETFADDSMTSSIDHSHEQSIESTSTVEPSTEPISEKSSLTRTVSTGDPAPPPYSRLAPASEVSAEPTPGPSRQQLDPAMHPTRRPQNTGGPAPNPSSRTSLFLPHPHAPKPAQSPAGPMYGRQPVVPSHLISRPGGPPPGTILHSLNMVLIARHEGRPGRTTIYGKFERDLASSLGPVPITFSVDPPPPPPHMTASAHGPRMVGPAKEPRSGSPLSSQPSLSTREGTPPSQTRPEVGHEAQGPSSKAVPRANFFPKTASPRPRSRSFSGFNKPFAEMFLPESKRYEVSIVSFSF